VPKSSASPPAGATATFRSRAGYASGDLGISIAYFAFGFFFLYYLTDLVGLPPATAGVVMLIGKLWDGVNDPLIGVLSDRTRSRHGRKRVYLLYGSVPFGVSFAILWWIPAGASDGAKAALATALVLIFATTYSFVGVPYQALVPVISGDYDERTRLVGFKAVFSAIGAILGGIIALVLGDGDDMTSTLRLMALGFGVAITVLVLIAAFSTRRASHDDTHPIAPVPLRDYVRLAAEPNVSTLLGYKVLAAVATGVMTAALPFFADHVVGDGRLSTVSLAIYTIVGGGLVAVWVRLARRYDKRRLVLVSNAAAGAVLVAIALLATSDAAVVFLVGSALLGMAMAAHLVLPPSLVPDLVDWYEHASGRRHESVFFGLWMTVHQLGLGVAALVLGLVLQWSGYVQDAEVQSAGAVTGVRLAFGLVPAVFLILSALVLQRYRITRESHAEARAALAAASALSP